MSLHSAASAEHLYSLVYTSEALTPFDDDSLRTLLTDSRAANHHAGITGILLYRDGRFVQLLEGPEGSVRSLMRTISDDPRHHRVRVLVDGYPKDRQFSAWTMGYEPISTEPTAPPEGFRDTFTDIEAVDDNDAVLRAARELALWFRVRSDRSR